MNQPKQSTLPFAEVMEITPAIAKNWLKTNAGNRSVSKANLATISAEMRAGKWQLNGESIKFDINDRLVDGQHRLLACVETNISFTSMVVMGVQPEAFDTLDTGKRRGIADVLSIHGHIATSRLAAGIRAAMFMDGTISSLNDKTTNQQAMDWFDANKDIALYSQAGPVVKTLFSAYVFCGMRYLCMKNHPVQAQLFFEQLESGLGLTERSPVKVLRDRMLVQKSKMAQLNQLDALALAIKAWNLFLTGRTITVIRWAKDEEFPKLK